MATLRYPLMKVVDLHGRRWLTVIVFGLLWEQ